jgi:hypothetical protein
MLAPGGLGRSLSGKVPNSPRAASYSQRFLTSDLLDI